MNMSDLIISFTSRDPHLLVEYKYKIDNNLFIIYVYDIDSIDVQYINNDIVIWQTYHNSMITVIQLMNTTIEGITK